MISLRQLMLLPAMLGTTMLLAQHVVVHSEKRVSKGISHPVNEPHLIVNPRDAQHLLVAAIVTTAWQQGEAPESYIVLYQSHDSGSTWIEHHFQAGITMGADPWLAMNQEGTLILTSLNRQAGKDGVRMLTFISHDAGGTWEEHVLDLGTGHDRQSIVVDPVTQHFLIASAKFNKNRDNRTISGIMITRLTSAGMLLEANWHGFSNVDKNNGTPVITTDGMLLMPFVDYMVNGRRLKTRRHWLVSSDDLGRTFDDPILLSEDGSFPKLLLDTTGQGTGLHYLNSDGQQRDYAGYTLRTSQDGGYTWSEGVDVDQYKGDTPYIRNAEWAINPRGEIMVCWFDGRTSEAGGHDLYCAASKDRARSFGAPMRITAGTSYPDAEANGMVDRRWPVGGDYFGLAAGGDGRFHLTWCDHRHGKPQLFHAVLSVEP